MAHVSLDVAAVAAAFVFAAIGGELFLRGVLGIARLARLPRAVVATTIAAFVTSAPEFLVSVVSATDDHPEIGLGDTLGSNVVNIALILGLVLLRGNLRAEAADHRTTVYFALAAPFLTLVLLLDGHLRRWEGVVLLLFFAVWLAVTLDAALRRRRAGFVPDAADSPTPWSIPLLVGGLIALLIAGRLFVAGATGLAARLGVDDYVVGSIVVAIGTSLPELVTVLVSRRRGHDDIGLGTLLGSNLFNGLAIVGVVATIRPISVPLVEVAVALAFGWLALVLVLPRHDVVPRSRGPLLLGVYAAYVVVTLLVVAGEAS